MLIPCKDNIAENNIKWDKFQLFSSLFNVQIMTISKWTIITFVVTDTVKHIYMNQEVKVL